MGLEIPQFICLEDNLGLLVRDEASGAAALTREVAAASLNDETILRLMLPQY